MKIIRKIGAIVLVLALCAGVMCTQAFAVQTMPDGNLWYGDELAVDVAAGSEGYTYMALFRAPASGYEFCGHFMGSESPQTFVVIDTEAHDGTTWTPDGVYASGKSNYEVAYCCDVETMIVDGTYYKRLNLEDSEYYTDAQAAKIRAIVTNAYPYVTLEEMKADLAANGFADAQKLTRGEIIAAVQTAIWAAANTNGEALTYTRSYRVTDNYQWGQPLHDTSDESGLDVAGRRNFVVSEEVGARINTLVQYLLAQEEVYASKKQIVITDMKLMGAPVTMSEEEQTSKIALRLTLNNSGSGYEDNIAITVTTGLEEKVIPVVYGTNTYDIEVTALRGDEIVAEVAGTQMLPQGVYFYAPQPEDINGDGIATGREVSQNLVGVAMGETSVYCRDSISFSEVTFEPGTASNISYMLIDEKTGAVEFVEKIDLDSTDYFAPILQAEGYISAMFIKQSTSGMFWFAQEVDDAAVEAVIECLKANNPSYKGHNAIAFGEGAHDLEFKKGKIVTYIFGDEVILEETEEVIPEETEEAAEEETEETVPQETEAEEETSKNNKNKNKVKIKKK